MNGRERVITALRRGIPDRIPYVEPRIDTFVLHSYGGSDYTYDDFVEEFDLDGVVVWPDYNRPGCGWAGWKSKEIRDGRLEDKWGCVRKSGNMEYWVALGDECAPIKTLKDLNTYEPPELRKKDYFEPLKKAVERFKGSKAIILRNRDVWSRPRDLLGYQRFLLSTINNKELIRRVVDMSVDFNKRVNEIAADLGAEAVWFSDDIADNRSLLVSPDTYKELFWPKFKELVRHAHKQGLLVIKHSDGYLMPIMDILIDAEIDCINPIEPYAKMSLREVKRKYSTKIAVMGNVDCRRLLPEGTKHEITQGVKKCICEGGPNGGYILSSSNTIHKGIPVSNYLQMLKAWNRYREYPLSC